MKRWLAICILLSILITLCSCTSESPVPSGAEETKAATPHSSTPVTDVTTPNESTEPIQYNLPLAAISMPVMTQTVYSEDNTLLFTNTYQNVALILEDADIAHSVVLDLLNHIDSANASAQDIMRAAKADYTGQDNWTPYVCKVLLNPQRLDQGVLSLYGEEVTYSGSTRPAAVPKSISYSLLTGTELSITDILQDNYDSSALSQHIIASLSEYEANGLLFWDYQEIISDRFQGDISHIDSWYFSEDALCFYFSPYDIAPYATGTVIAQVSYEQLDGILRDEFFPPEKIPTPGTMHAVLFSKAPLDSFAGFAEIVLDSEGESIIVYADGIVFDVAIELGSWTSDGTQFVPEATVFRAESLTPSDAIMLQAYIPDTLPNLRLSYTTQDEAVTLFISQSGENGDILLISE